MLDIILAKGRDRRSKAGHPWIFSNEIGELRGDRSPGCSARVLDAAGRLVGTGYFNPHSLIAVRLLSRQERDVDQPELYRERIAAALRFREMLYPGQTTYRLVHGEGDFLSGLVVDRYDQYLSVQLLSAGMEQRWPIIEEVLNDLLAPQGIMLRNDVAVRQLEGLPEERRVACGSVPERCPYQENGLQFLADLRAGQKTGSFLDQKENHQLLAPICNGAAVLDCFCYSGSWGVHAATYGAREVTCLDISAAAIALAQQNADCNRVRERMQFVAVDVFDQLREYKSAGRQFDVIVLDPPAFVKNRKSLDEAVKGYTTINRRALELLRPGGYLITCSCSYHLGREPFRELLTVAAQLARRDVRFVTMRTQSPDHPILLQVPETEYLKCCLLQVV
jgi:23S rRNA (cytosine1962-C5)-methyltransferase